MLGGGADVQGEKDEARGQRRKDEAQRRKDVDVPDDKNFKFYSFYIKFE